ncbi:MAG: U32 family peptidase [Candidatus Omnitrophica bacterium]|nr:U32 family peptidase [Candidatus Omnitrophota bacterium]
MRILSPLRCVDEVKPLSLAGADEFYCGLMHSSQALNDRPNTPDFNFKSAQELKKAVCVAHENNKSVYLAINNLAPTLNEALTQARIANEINIDGCIVSNLLIIKKIHQSFPKLRLCASCLTATLNSQELCLLKSLGVRLVHLPRQLGLDDLNALNKNNPGVELSVFALNGMCVNIESFCSLHYLKKEYFIPCHHFKAARVIGDKGFGVESFNALINSPKFSCAICALRKLKKMGILSLKIEGRGMDLKNKIRSIQLLKEACKLLDEKTSDLVFRGNCRKIFKYYLHEDCKKEYCYF